MTHRHKISHTAIILGAALTGALAVTAFAQTLPPDATVKAKAFKEADNAYLKSLCNGSKSDRHEALAVRARAEDDLEKTIVDTVRQAPEVQKALDAAADAGEAADKIAASSSASDREKSDAQDKFQSAKADLRAVVTQQRSRIEAQVSHDFDVKFDPAADCPDQPKAAEHHKAAPAKSARSSHERPRRVREQNEGASAGTEVPVSIGIGGGGVGIGVGGGGFGISIGR